MKLQHFQTIQFSFKECQGHDIHNMPQHSAEPTPHAGLGALLPNFVGMQVDARDGLVNLQRLGQGLEAATDQS